MGREDEGLVRSLPGTTLAEAVCRPALLPVPRLSRSSPSLYSQSPPIDSSPDLHRFQQSTPIRAARFQYPARTIVTSQPRSFTGCKHAIDRHPIIFDRLLSFPHALSSGYRVRRSGAASPRSPPWCPSGPSLQLPVYVFRNILLNNYYELIDGNIQESWTRVDDGSGCSAL